MSKIKFKLDDVSKDFNLIAIRSDVEDYRMVYFLNKKLNIKLHAAEDSFIPLGESATATLPSEESIINSAVDLLNE